MRKTTRVSIILIAIGILLIPEAYMAPDGERRPHGVASVNSPIISDALFLYRGQILEGGFTANASVNFYLTDETNYLAFVQDSSWHPLVSLLDVSNESFNFVAPATGYYRTIAVVNQSQENVELNTSMKFYGINLDYYQSGQVFLAVGFILIVTDAIRYLKSRSSQKPPAE